MADNDAAPAGRKRVRRPSQLTSDARSSKEPARASSSRPTPAEKAEAQETIAEMKAVAVSPPILATRGRKAEPHIVACALAMQRGEKFAEIAADFGIRTDQSPQGVWVDSKLAQLRAYRQQQLAAEAEAACAEFRAVTQARWEADPEYDPDSLYDDELIRRSTRRTRSPRYGLASQESRSRACQTGARPTLPTTCETRTGNTLSRARSP